MPAVQSRAVRLELAGLGRVLGLGWTDEPPASFRVIEGGPR
ncbi:hypothetical protein BJ986_000368 [Phycicoccus badiiscoriae]|uniref:Uncharacterized protein n=1 Tax=Pedococcus badiiscoriae TaxID=642776 RepID=A0A852WEN6_9MICO|nr:hypothetical protein [Pedococcus badiiscoriae]NYG05881.1 hypothetical protein [Pedococcus badiiscoriae]